MNKNIIAIVGRPNVGKSTFFNRVSGQKISIVENRAGVTRDRVYADSEWNGRSFTLIDTGGLELKSKDEMFMHIKLQAEIAIDLANIILFFVDAKTQLCMDDYEVVSYLRKSNKKIYLVVNKVDNFNIDEYIDYYNLGIADLYPISSENGNGIADLLDEIVSNFSQDEIEEKKDSIKIAFVGKPNAGKSSLTNKILGYDRTIVSDIAGTTRDSIDSEFEYANQHYTLIDTAGIRRARSIDDNVEQYSVTRALASIRRADVCVLVIDSSEEISEQDIRIAGYIHEQGKPSVIVMNKWDLVEKDTHTINKFNAKLSEDLKFMAYFRSIFISAKTGQRVEKLLEQVKYVYEKSCQKVTTGVLNDVILDAVATCEPPLRGGRRLKIYYATQVGIQPPTFVLFVNDTRRMHFSYRRYLENKLREAFSFEGTPIRILLRDKQEESVF